MWAFGALGVAALAALVAFYATHMTIELGFLHKAEFLKSTPAHPVPVEAKGITYFIDSRSAYWHHLAESWMYPLLVFGLGSLFLAGGFKELRDERRKLAAGQPVEEA